VDRALFARNDLPVLPECLAIRVNAVGRVVVQTVIVAGCKEIVGGFHYRPVGQTEFLRVVAQPLLSDVSLADLLDVGLGAERLFGVLERRVRPVVAQRGDRVGIEEHEEALALLHGRSQKRINDAKLRRALRPNDLRRAFVHEANMLPRLEVFASDDRRDRHMDRVPLGVLVEEFANLRLHFAHARLFRKCKSRRPATRADLRVVRVRPLWVFLRRLSWQSSKKKHLAGLVFRGSPGRILGLVRDLAPQMPAKTLRQGLSTCLLVPEV
jgi:hypothetical protein